MVEKIDVEKIVETIRQKEVEKVEIKDISYVYDKIKQESQNKECDILTMERALKRFADKRAIQILDYLKPRCEMKYYREIENKSAVKRFIKKAIRKTLKFCIYPMATEQSIFNLNLVELIEQQQIQIQELRTQIENLTK